MPISFIPYTAVYGPLSIPGVSCSLWLDAADPTQISFSSSTNVSTWNDKSGFRNSCSNQSLSTTITYPGTQVNGLNTVNFTAGCIRGAFNGSSVINTTDVSIFIVTAETAPNNNLRMFSLTTAANYQDDTANTMLVYCAPGNYQLTFYRGGVMPTPYTVTQNVPFIYSLTQTSGTGSMWLNGGSNVTASITNSNFAVTNYNIGTLYLANQNYTGLMCEIVLYNSLLSTPQRQAIEGYLAQKWGLTSQLPAGHPGLTQTLYNGKVYQPQISLKPAPYANYYPLSIGGCALWLDGADPNGTGVLPSNGASLTIWVDKSGNTYNVSQNASLAVPVFRQNLATNGLPGLDFTGGGGLLSATSFAKSLNVTLLLVGMVRSTIGGWGTFWGHFPNGDHDFNAIQLRNTSGQTVINWHTNNNNSTSQLSYTLNSMVLYSCTMTNGNIMFMQQTNTSGTNSVTITNAAVTINTNTAPIWVGRSDSSEAINSYIYEIVYFQRVLSLAERQQTEGYLAWKWGLQSSLPITHPYYSAPPLQYTRGSILGAPTLNNIARLPPIVATGGTITFSGSYKIHTFTTVGSTNFTITQPYATQLQVLIVGGGGGGGNNCGGGGGAGGVAFLNSQSVAAGSYSVIVGAGGAGGINPGAPIYGSQGSNGTSSTAFGLTGIGGGGGGWSTQAPYVQTSGTDGGCGGGGAGGGATAPSLGGAALQRGGFTGGGQPSTSGPNYGGGGGGGMGSVGSNGSGNTGGNGGNGASYTIGGTAYTLAGGGGGGTYNASGGSGGSGGAGAGAGSPNISGGNATYYGSGGGGSAGGGVATAGGAGYQGIVIIAYDYL